MKIPVKETNIFFTWFKIMYINWDAFCQFLSSHCSFLNRVESSGAKRFPPVPRTLPVHYEVCVFLLNFTLSSCFALSNRYPMAMGTLADLEDQDPIPGKENPLKIHLKVNLWRRFQLWKFSIAATDFRQLEKWGGQFHVSIVKVPFRLSNRTCSDIKLTMLSTNKASQSHGISQSEAEEGGSCQERIS